MLNQTIQLLQQALDNLRQLQDPESIPQLPVITRTRILEPTSEEYKEPVPYKVDEPDNHLNKEQCCECINRTIEQFRHWRQVNCLKAETLEEVLDAHSQNYYRTLRQQIYKFIIITDGFRYSRGLAREKMAHCPFCKFQNLLTYVTAHVLKKHANNYQIYSCAICNKDFQSHRLLIVHIHNYHKEGTEQPRKRHTQQVKQMDDEIFEEPDSPEISL